MDVKDNGGLHGVHASGNGQEGPDFVCRLEIGAIGLPDRLDEEREGGRERARENSRGLTTSQSFSM